MRSVNFPRKLAAIMHADVAGYSRLTEQDEEGTHLRVLRYKRLFAEQILHHDGNVVHSEGDSLLADFSSASNAIICALAVQKSLALQNCELSEYRRVHFRIGINLSEVNVDKARQRIFGYGVNVAARLESLAEPGGVCVSQSMQEAIPETLPVTMHFLGVRAVKNITQPLRVFNASLAPGAELPQPEHQRLFSEGEQNSSASTAEITDTRKSPVFLDLSQPIGLPVMQDTTLSSSGELLITRSMMQRLLASILYKPLGISHNHIIHDPSWRERVARHLDSTPRTMAIEVHAGFLQRWLRWNQSRFGPYRGSVWKLFDFCLLHAFIYSSLFFFIGLIFLQGDAFIGELQISMLEIGPQAIHNLTSSSQFIRGEAGTLPLLLLIFVVYAIINRLWWKSRPADSRRVKYDFDARRFAMWLVLSSIVGFLLALNGFGAGLVALSVAIGACFLRSMPGSGLMYLGITALIILILDAIVIGAEAGQPAMQSLAQSLHGLIRDDVDRFLLLWFLFPVINAVFDTLSWRLSRRLGLALRFGQRTLTGLWLSGSKKTQPILQKTTLADYWLSTLYWGLLDLVIALLLLMGAATGIGASLELFDYVRRDYSGFFAPEHLIKVFTSDPLGQGFWLTAMLVTTLVPTALHLMAVGCGLVSTLARPVEQGPRLSSVLMYGPAHPLFDLASRQAAWLQLTRVVQTITLTCAWAFLLGWLILSALHSGAALQLLGNSLRVGQQFAAIMIDLSR